MSEIRTLPAHEIVARVHPRPPPSEVDEVGMAVGRVIDEVLAEFGHRVRTGRRWSAAQIRTRAREGLDLAFAEVSGDVPPSERDRLVGQVAEVAQVYRGSPIYGLARPKTRIVLIDGRVGVYAQPDFWDGRSRFFELKSYRAIPPPPDVSLQLRLFQLAYPGFEAHLVCLDRHATPVTVTSAIVPAPSPEEAQRTLRLAYDLGQEYGVPKVFEYLEGPFVRLALDPVPTESPRPADSSPDGGPAPAPRDPVS